MPKVNELVTLAAAADLAGVARSTMVSAVDRGELVAYWTGCGKLRLVRRADVLAWAQVERKPGPKKAGKRKK